MRCPWCGSPVMIRGSSWECGWCGDFGSLQRTPAKKSQNTAQITLTLSFVYHVDLPETWNDLKKALGRLAPKNTVLSQLLGKVLLHHISAGIQHAGALPDEKKAEELRTFLHNTLDLNLDESAEEIMRDAKRGVLFCEEAALSETDCGTFWTELLSTRPVEDYYNHVDPDGLFELFSELSSAYAYFGGKKDEEMGEAQDYQNALEEAYNTHWQNKVLLHPDVERAKGLLAQGKFPDYEDICREILLVEYPEEVPHETAEDFDEMSWERVLDDVFTRDPEKSIQMWRRLLDIAEPSLKINAKTAEKLLPDWDWLDSPTDDQALPLLVALDDERFVSQLFERRVPRQIAVQCSGDLSGLWGENAGAALYGPCTEKSLSGGAVEETVYTGPCGCTFFKTHKATCLCTCKTARQYTGKADWRKLLSVLQCAVQGGWRDICLSDRGNFAESRRFCSRSDRRSSSRKACSGDRGVRLQHTECAISAGEGEICAPQV